jgi:nicotinamidase-related amidase
MPNPHSLPRSPDLLTATDNVLVVIDVQEKLIPLMPQPARLIFNIRRLLEGARTLGVEVISTEQYPEKLGPTDPELSQFLEQPAPKRDFSCGECGDLFQPLAAKGIHKVVLVGMETHVCVLQTAFDLLAAGFSVYLVVDGLTARNDIDHETAIRRLESSGAILTTCETVLFEWCQTSTATRFKDISRLVKQKLT